MLVNYPESYAHTISAVLCAKAVFTLNHQKGSYILCRNLKDLGGNLELNLREKRASILFLVFPVTFGESLLEMITAMIYDIMNKVKIKNTHLFKIMHLRKHHGFKWNLFYFILTTHHTTQVYTPHFKRPYQRKLSTQLAHMVFGTSKFSTQAGQINWLLLINSTF